MPVLPSDIDIHAAAKCISDLLLIAKIRREDQRIAVIANRVKKNTLVYKALMKFLETLNIPVVATLRDSQNYIRAAESGLGLFEMKPNQVREDHGAVAAADRLAGAAPAAAHRAGHACDHFGGEREFVADAARPPAAAVVRRVSRGESRAGVSDRRRRCRSAGARLRSRHGSTIG